jgi:hypothetical protein
MTMTRFAARWMPRTRAFAITVVLFFANAMPSFAQEIRGIETVGAHAVSITIDALIQAKNSIASTSTQERTSRNAALIEQLETLVNARTIKPDANNSSHVVANDQTAASTTDRAASQAKASSVSSASVAIATQFTAIAWTGSGVVQADASFDVGPTQIVAAANGVLRTFSKSTGVADGVLDLTTETFFASVRTPGSSTFFPQVRFDRTTQRWFIVMTELVLDGSGYLPNRMLIAVSQAATLTSTSSFNFFWFSTTTSGTTFAPYLGIDANAIYIGTEQFSSTLTYQGGNAYVVRKSSLLSTGPIVTTTFQIFQPQTTLFRSLLTGVDNPDPAATHGYLVAAGPTSGGLQVWRVSNPGGTPTISAAINIADSTRADEPVSVPHFGNTTGKNLRGFAAHLNQALIRNGRLWVSNAISKGPGSTAPTTSNRRNGVRWYDIENLATTPSLRQLGTIIDDTVDSPRHYWVPSLTVSGQGHTYFGFSTAGQFNYADAATSYRLNSDSIGSARAPQRITDSIFAYNLDFVTLNTLRWGDQSRTVIDPDDDMTAWTIQQFTHGTNAWGLRVAKLRAPPPPAFTPTPITVASGSTNNITLNATSVAGGEGFFDPGTGFSKRLQVSLPGFTVNSVQYVNPTQIVVNATANAGTTAVAGAIVTNPDGQTSAYGTAARTLTVVAENGRGAVTNIAVTAAAPCTGICVNHALPGRVFELLAMPSADSVFVGWTSSAPGLCAGFSTTCTLTLTDNATVYATFAPFALYAYQSFNIDANINFPSCSATVDAAMIARFMRGVGGAAISGVGIPSDAANNAAAIALQLAYRKPYLDADGNGVIDATTDGLLVLRYLAGFRGSALTANALGAPPRRTDAQIENYLSERTAGFPNSCVAQ